MNKVNGEGVKDGYWEHLYFTSRKISSKGFYKNGKSDGYWKYYYVNGNLMWEGNYSKGVQIGLWLGYNEKGKLIEKYFFARM